MSGLYPTAEEVERRSYVIKSLRQAIRENVTIKLPDLGSAPGPYEGEVGGFRYRFEGEEDLLHLIITRSGETPLTPDHGQEVAEFLLPGMPSGLVWIRPGELSQHFYLGHDDLLEHVTE